MADEHNPQLEDGYTRIANEWLEAFIQYPAPGSLKSFVLVVVRETWGYGETWRQISVEQFQDILNLRRSRIYQLRRDAWAHNLIEIEETTAGRGGIVSRYSVQKQYIEWLDYGSSTALRARREITGSLDIKFKVKRADGYCCQRCQSRPGRLDLLHAHHIIPAALGGQDIIENLVSLCAPCHRIVQKAGVDFKLPPRCQSPVDGGQQSPVDGGQQSPVDGGQQSPVDGGHNYKESLKETIKKGTTKARADTDAPPKKKELTPQKKAIETLWEAFGFTVQYTDKAAGLKSEPGGRGYSGLIQLVAEHGIPLVEEYAAFIRRSPPKLPEGAKQQPWFTKQFRTAMSQQWKWRPEAKKSGKTIPARGDVDYGKPGKIQM